MTKKTTAASVIRNGINKGFSTEKILKLVKEKVPTSNADESHVAYYVNRMFKDGKIDQARHDKYLKNRGRPAGKADTPAKKKVVKKKTATPAKKKVKLRKK